MGSIIRKLAPKARRDLARYGVVRKEGGGHLVIIIKKVPESRKRSLVLLWKIAETINELELSKFTFRAH